jgi:hypothetical protein
MDERLFRMERWRPHPSRPGASHCVEGGGGSWSSGRLWETRSGWIALDADGQEVIAYERDGSVAVTAAEAARRSAAAAMAAKKKLMIKQKEERLAQKKARKEAEARAVAERQARDAERAAEVTRKRFAKMMSQRR